MRPHPRQTPVLSVSQHAFLLQHSVRNTVVSCKRGHLRCRVVARPTEISRFYTLLIEYQKGRHPVSTVVSPNLGELTNRTIPHLYRQGPFELCLYYPPNREWKPTMHLAKTIFPWCMEWLFHFECWLSTGVWDGGGTTHATIQNEN